MFVYMLKKISHFLVKVILLLLLYMHSEELKKSATVKSR